MTEQEKREKAIDEMVLDGAECSHIAEWWNCKRCKHSPCGARRTCENLVDKNYRKAEEVIKMTAKGLIQDFLKLCNMNGMTVEIVKKNLITMAEVIGVEVEE